MKKKKILHVVSTINGGVGRVVEDILVGCSDDFEMSLLVLGNTDRLDLKRLGKYNIKIDSWNLSNEKNLFLILRLYRYIRQKKINIINVHLFPLLYYVAFISVFLYKIKYIYTEHSTLSNRHKGWMRPIEKLIYSRYNVIIAVSGSVSSMLNNWVEKDTVITVNNGYDMNNSNFETSIVFLNDRYKGKKIITMASRFVLGKDFETLIDAVALLSDKYHLILVGDGNRLSVVKDYAKKKKVLNRVDFLGFRDDVLNIFKGSDLVVLSSSFEGLPVVLLESISVNTLVLGSEVPGIVDVLEDTELLFEYGNSDELARKIDLIINNKDNYNDIISKIKIKFDINCSINGYKNVYKKLI